MSKRRYSGGVKGNLPTISINSATGVWDLFAVHAQRSGSTWPSMTLPDNFAYIFGSATTFTIQTVNEWTVAYNFYSTYSSARSQNANAFWSYISTSATTPNSGTSNWYDQGVVPVSHQTSTLSSPSASQTSGYTVSQSVVWSSTDDGIWMSSYTSTSTITVNISAADFALAKYFVYRGYGSSYSYHNPLVIRITANGISRLFATQSLSGRTYPGNIKYVAYFAPLNSSFTSFDDSRLVNGSTTLDASYFQWI